MMVYFSIQGLLMTLRSKLLIALLASALSACGAAPEGGFAYVERPVEEIYMSAVEELERRNYIRASQEFDEVERQHPYSLWARPAMVMSAYT